MASAPISILISTLIGCVFGACTFNATWHGKWFQSGLQQLITINRSHIETKGECFDQNYDKFLLFNKNENCYKCLAIHEKFEGVLQYKESICDDAAPASFQRRPQHPRPHRPLLGDVCALMLGDDPLHTMFRKTPPVPPLACPFKMAPFLFSYSRGTGECSNPPSRAESCTDESRLVFKYQACPDVASTESYVEELKCLATWKEGSTRYLIGRLKQLINNNFNYNNNNQLLMENDEDQLRCFIYQREKSTNRTLYNLAQSADATCNGIINSFEGSKTLKLITVDNQHNRCKFPKWLTDHHTWLSLDKKKIYKFTQKNATLKILKEEEDGKFSGDFPKEFKVVCNSILEFSEGRKIKIVAHVTSGCDSGYICMIFHKRSTRIVQLLQSEKIYENSEEACSNMNDEEENSGKFSTLTTTNLIEEKCPFLGRFESENSAGKCGKFLDFGCENENRLNFKRKCAENDEQEEEEKKEIYGRKEEEEEEEENAFICHGSWTSSDATNIVVATLETRRKMAENSRISTGKFGQKLAENSTSKRFCFAWKFDGIEAEKSMENSGFLRMIREADDCPARRPNGNFWAWNFTRKGACDSENRANSATTSNFPTLLLFSIKIIIILLLLLKS